MIGNLVGHYKIVEKIGEGGMGAVFRGIDIMLEREVAIKMLRPELASQPEVVERFRAEGVTLAKLNHPNIATLYTFLRQGYDFFMVLEFVRGETLDSMIRKMGAIEPNHAVTLFCQALEGIDYAHRMGIIHRDIKPGNIMLTPEGSIKVMDFGIARVLGTARMTRQGNIVGTVEYMSPEQVRGLESDARSDVYSLGIVLYEMLTGRVPFNSDSEFELMRAQVEQAPAPPRTFTENISIRIEQVIMRSLAKKIEARYQTANEFRAALQDAIGVSANSMANKISGYITPSPGIQPSAAQPPSGEILKETRLATHSSDSTHPLSHAIANDQMKETRLGQQSGPQFSDPYHIAHPIEAPAQINQSRPSAFSKLNWKHYTAAAIVAAVLICAPIALIRSKAQEPLPQTPSSQAPSSTVEPARNPTPSDSEPMAAPQPASALTPSEPLTSLEKALEGEPSSAQDAKPTRQRGSRAERNAETPQPVEETPAQEPAPRPKMTEPPPRTQPASPQVEEPKPPQKEERKRGKNGEVVEASDKKKSDDKDKKKGGFFKVFKKIFRKD